MQHAWADDVIKENLTPKGFVYSALAAVETDSRTAGPDRIFNPIIKVVAWFARKAGVARRLEAKYYRPSTGDVAAT